MSLGICIFIQPSTLSTAFHRVAKISSSVGNAPQNCGRMELLQTSSIIVGFAVGLTFSPREARWANLVTERGATGAQSPHISAAFHPGENIQGQVLKPRTLAVAALVKRNVMGSLSVYQTGSSGKLLSASVQLSDL